MNEVFEKIAKKKVLNANNTIDPHKLKELIFRITQSDEYVEKFEFIQLEETALDAYIMYDKNDKIVIEATSGVACAVAFNLYLREYCNSYVGPITRNVNLPKQPPSIGKVIQNKSVFLFRYFMNYCTFSYSLLFADWSEWEKLTDWMLLSGINLYLNIVGHEIVWRDTLLESGYTQQEVSEYICGPAYLPWQWMGNMTHFGGNLPQWWYTKQKNLGNKINAKMRSFGAEPISPGYFGIVPRDYKEKVPAAHPIDQGTWFDTFDQPSILMPEGNTFDKIAEIFYNKTKLHFGDINYFSGDPFHEGGNSDGLNFGEYCNKVIDNVKSASKNAIWFLQGWSDTPKREMLNKIDKEDVIVLSLSADNNYNVCDNFNGYPWIYCATPNFGGTRKMDGNLKGFMNEPYDALANENITTVGIGMTMEAVEMDEMLYEGISYNAIRSSQPDMNKFVEDFVRARYGTVNNDILQVFRTFANDIYVLNQDNIYSGRESGLCTIPSLDVKTVSYSSISYNVDYDEEKLKHCKELLLKNYNIFKDNECFKFDLTEISREINANNSWHLLDGFISAYKSNDYEQFDTLSSEFLSLYDIQDKLMSENTKTRLDSFIDHAKAYATCAATRDMFVFNAVNLIMLWSKKEHPPYLIDYAYREWNGMMPYYKKRWQAFIELMRMNFGKSEELVNINWMDYSFIEVMNIVCNERNQQ